MKLVALIVTFNRLEKLKKCWAATAALNFTEIVIVNNASTDDTFQWLSTLIDERLTVISLMDNVGGAGGFKAGVSHIKETSTAQWVVFYDDDAYPPDDLFKKFESIKADTYQAYCCLVQDMNSKLCKMNLPYSNFPATLIDTLKYTFKPELFLPDINTSQTVASFSFVGLIIEKELIVSNIDCIYPELFIYYDDLYLSRMLVRKGCQIRFSNEIVFTHDVAPDSKVISPSWKVYYLVRNLILARHLPGQITHYSMSAICLRIFKYFILIFKQKEKKEFLTYILKGIIDGISNKTGKQH